jgi:hypothetical protein
MQDKNKELDVVLEYGVNAGVPLIVLQAAMYRAILHFKGKTAADQFERLMDGFWREGVREQAKVEVREQARLEVRHPPDRPVPPDILRDISRSDAKTTESNDERVTTTKPATRP